MDIAVDANGYPMVAWSDNSGDPNGRSQVYLKAWNGTTWVELGGSATGGGVSSMSSVWAALSPSLSIDPLGHPVVAWEAVTATGWNIYCRRWDGSNWVELGGSGSGTGVSGNNMNSSYEPSLALNSMGNPYITWHDNTLTGYGDFEIYLKYWDAATETWVGLGGSAEGTGISTNFGGSVSPSLALDSESRPYISWRDTSSDRNHAYLRYWNGSTWEELGGSATTEGVSGGGGEAINVKMALDSLNRPYVSWTDVNSNPEVLLRYWDGSAWTELRGSGSGGGVSNTSTTSYLADLALDSAGHPVIVWWEYVNPPSNNSEVYLKAWQP